jgi:hypothetical protein
VVVLSIKVHEPSTIPAAFSRRRGRAAVSGPVIFAVPVARLPGFTGRGGSGSPSVDSVTSPGQGAVRVLRGSALATCCTLLALSGHVLGGGSVGSVLAMLVVAAPLGGAFVVWADRQRGPVELAAAGLVAQLAFHLVFALCGGGGVASHEPAAASWMVAGHVVAAAVAAWLLSSGEAALWGLYRALTGVVVRRVVRRQVPVRVAAVRHLVDAVPVVTAEGPEAARANPRRGPPRALAV